MNSRFFLFFILAIFSFIIPRTSQASLCSDWVTCDLGLPANTVPVADYNTYPYDAESDHFVYFRDPTTTYAAYFDAALYQELQDQFECAYSYFVCHLGLDATSITEKVQVYIGDLSNTGGSKGYITTSDYNISSNPADPQITIDSKTAKRTTVPVHEFFHIIQANNYSTNIYESISEGWAVLAEQMASENNFEQSFFDSLRLKGFWAPEDSGAYGLSIFWRYLFEQLYGAPLNPADVDEDWAVSDFLEDALLHLASMGPNPTIVQFLGSFIPAYATGSSYASTPQDIVQNFITALYAFQYVDPLVQPEFAFSSETTITTALDGSYLVNNVLNNCPEECLDYYSTGNVMAVGDVLNFDNTATVYGGVDPGFRYFLNAEYHILEPDLNTVKKLLFTKTNYDSDIHFQLIIRYDNGTVLSKNILKRNHTSRRVKLRARSHIEEIVLVIYTTNYNPITSGMGRTFTLDVEAI